MDRNLTMQVHFGLASLSAEWSHSVVCIGTFDGVHLGHQAVICRAVEQARHRGVPSCVVTFDRHPAATLAPDRKPPAISTLEETFSWLEALGVELVAILPFDKEMSEMPAERFLDEIVIQKLGAEVLVVGHDFAMGKGRQGDTHWLKERIPTEVIPPLEIDGQRVSSSSIRKALREGDVSMAAGLLGRPFALAGVVVGGKRLGRQLGFPTANIARSVDQALPADGIYAGRWISRIGEYWAAVSVGLRPAVGGTDRTVEAYLLDFPGASLYGHTCRLEFLSRLRGEQNFETLDALTEQIQRDIERVRDFAREYERGPSLNV
ncbi:MAG TPA: bifunctional riboflavin kinase/FAD synthetase [Fimbriimonas sp.]|nr:bifunctional riboflavin kinase/FAD synthetase [Fimbriimonas sp.]